MLDSFGAGYLCRLASGTNRYGGNGKRKIAVKLLRFSLFSPNFLRFFAWCGELGMLVKRP